ncbi:hypothetical protein THC_0485 [Caldimicrobium thiodismutans]|jgi:hypothetical protein|uniref:Cardiolipin synthase N-terminal domain-containing protein n=1 Tax=Caldimicrobium thiodismutans TaxID=1653476 RepID=A0A0U5AWT7_9BACT|nr:PLDc N-terminal domain-containing protein [Caldimicrobium thiodismutans]BAU22879.1 hypothetical protein THC_0485 [Caldimicrobium thiodismutans]
MFEFFSGLFGILFFILFIVPFVLWIWALVDILKSEFTGYNKIIWLLLVIFLPLLGLILYYFIGRKQKIK